jgi:NitT/TauT family transport system substrate-binding protein
MSKRLLGPAALRCLAVASLLVMATPFAQAQKKPEPLKLALNWFPVGDHGAYFVALDKGYFSDNGLEVSIENSKGSGDSVAKADTGRADIAISDTAVILSAIARGAKVKIVGMIFDETPQNIFSRSETPLKLPKDLVGKSIGAPPGDSQRLAWPAFAKINGLDPNAVTWVNVEPTAKVPALVGKRVDGVADLLTGQPNYDKALGKGEVVTMPWANFGFNMYSMAFVASEETLEKRPEAVRAFLKAAYLGWRDVMAEREASLAIYKKRIPEIDVDYIRANQELGIGLMRTKRYAEHGIGWIDEKKMCDSVDVANTYMGLARPVDCKQVYTTEFLPKIALPLEPKEPQ